MTKKDLEMVPEFIMTRELNKEIKKIASNQTSYFSNLMFYVPSIYKSFLVIDLVLYNKETEKTSYKWRHILDKTSWMTLSLDTGKIGKSKLINVTSYYYCSNAINSEVILTWLKSDNDDAVSALYFFEDEVSLNLRVGKQNIEARKLNERWKGLKKPPKGFFNEIENIADVNLAYISKTKGTCTCPKCMSEFPLSEFKNPKVNQKGSHKCGTNVTFRSVKQRSDKDMWSSLIYLQPYGENVLSRTFKIRRSYKNYFPVESFVYEFSRTIVKEAGKYETFEYALYKSSTLAAWQKPAEPSWTKPDGYRSYIPETSHLYKRGLKNRLKGTVLENLKYDLWEELLGNFKKFYTKERIFIFFLQRPVIQEMLSRGYKKLAAEAFGLTSYYYSKHLDYFNTGSFYKDLGIRKSQLAQLDSEVNEKDIEAFRLANTSGINCNIDLLRKAREVFRHELARLLKNNKGLNLEKAVKYGEKLDYAPDYVDYLSDLKKVIYSTKENVECELYPKYFNQVHEQFSTLVKYANVDKYENDFSKLAPGWDKFNFSQGNLEIVVPKMAKDIVKEGINMHNCVGGYVEKVVKGECVILFIRKHSDPNKSFVTMEVRKNKIVQVRAYSNSKIDKETETFVNAFKKEKKIA